MRLIQHRRAGRLAQGVMVALALGLLGSAAAAAENSHIYWSNPGFSQNTIGRANLNGSEPNQSFITGAKSPFGVATDAAHVYWANASGNTIGRANLDGTGVNQAFITTSGPLPGEKEPSAVAVDGEYIYWLDNPGLIGRAKLDGTSVQPFFIEAGLNCDDLAV